MIYFLCFLVAFTILVISFIIKTFHWLSKQTYKIKVSRGARYVTQVAFPVVEILQLSFDPTDVVETRYSEVRYDVVDYKAVVAYSDNPYLMKNMFDPKRNFIRSEQQKEHMIRDKARKIGEDMLKDGIIKVTEFGWPETYDSSYPDPYMKHIVFEAKVCRPA